MPGMGGSPSPAGVPNVARSMPTVRNFQGRGGQTFEQHFTLTGITRDSTGAPLADCKVIIFRTDDDSVAARGVSDADGVYRLDASSELTHYVVSYKQDAPDVSGTTVNTLVGT